MDPNANLEEMLSLANEIQQAIDEDDDPDPCDVDRLTELVIALDGWISGGGFLPSRWQRKG